MWQWLERWLQRSDNHVGVGSVVRGQIAGTGSFRIDGRLEGNLETNGPVVIGPRGSILGDVRAPKVTVYGQLTGNVATTGELVVCAKGRVLGDAEMASFRVLPGGTFRGRTSVGARDQQQVKMLEKSLEAAAELKGRTLPPPGDRPVPPPVLRPGLSDAEPISISTPPPVASQERLRVDEEPVEETAQRLRAVP
jgi:cytoskeletal protein CcmA (bactofilin family)